MKATPILSLIFLSLFLVFGNPVIGQFPTDTQLTLNEMPVGIPKPAYLEPFIDPVYGSSVICISDEDVFGPTAMGSTDWWAPYRRHSWHKIQPWNADGSKIMINLTFPAYLVNGKTYEFIKRYDPKKVQNHPPSEAIWSNTNPDLMYGVSGNALIEFNVKTSIRKTLHTFSNYNAISLGLYEGNLSIDDKYIALWCPKGSVYTTVVYNLQSDAVVSTFDMGAYGVNDYATGVNWVSMSQSGDYVVILWQRSGSGRSRGLEVFDNKMNFIRQIYGSVSNGSIIELGMDEDGNDVAVYQDQITMDILTGRLSDGKVTKVLSGSKVSKATNISCRNILRPGWAYLSDFEAGDEAISTGWSTGKSDPSKASYNIVFALKLDGSETVEVFAHEHHSHNGGLYLQPMACPDPTGKRVMFASVWDNDDTSTSSVGGPFKTARIYDYVAEYKAPTIPNGLESFITGPDSSILSWRASKDDLPGISYEVFKDSVSIGSTTDTSMIITGLNPSTSYKLYVSATSSDGYRSPASEVLELTTWSTSMNPFEKTKETMAVRVSPNPMTDRCTIQITSVEEDDFTVILQDMTGRILHEQRLLKTREGSVQLGAYQKNAMYILRVANSKNQVVIKKLLQN